MHKHICKSCGSTMGVKKITKGSLLIEIVLWCFFIVPGVIYSIWRLTSKYDACKACNSPEIIPTNNF